MRTLGLVLLAVLVVPAPAASAAEFSPGSAGLGDPYFPLAGNGGYDVGHYSLVFSYDPATRQFDGTATVTATGDAEPVPLRSRSARLRHRSADRERRGRLVHPGRPGVGDHAGGGLPAGAVFTVVVGYAGIPSVVTDPDGSIEGWVPTDDGAFVVGEPQGSPAWYPANDNPRDKATYDFTATVPAGITVMANGVLDSRTTAGGRTTWVWRATSPMAPYLATATLGRFDLTQFTHRAGSRPTWRWIRLARPATCSGSCRTSSTSMPSIYGPYPFEAVGAIVDNAPEVGYSLETQTKPVFDRMPDEATLAHELSHMWYGDSVTLTEWPDIWLHEGFATWSEWIWSEHLGQKSAHNYFKTLYNTPAKDTAFWTPPPATRAAPRSCSTERSTTGAG